MSKAKKSNGKKSVAPELEPVDPDTRLVTLSLILERTGDLSSSSWDAITKGIVASTQLCGETHIVALSDALAQDNVAPSLEGVAQDGAASAHTLEITLVKRSVRVKNVEDLSAVVNGTAGKPHRVDLYTLPSPAAPAKATDDGEPSAGGGASAPTASSPKAKKAAKPKAAKKGQAPLDRPPLAQEDRIASTWFNACELLTECSVRIPVTMDRGKCTDGVAACWLRLSTGDVPLVDGATALRAVRPVFFTVHSLENLPSIPDSAPAAPDTAPPSADARTTAGANGGASVLHLRVEWGAHCFHVPVHDHHGAPQPTAVLVQSFCQSVLFLRDVAPFDAYRRAFDAPVVVTLVYTDPSHNQLPMGTGTLSLRDLVTDDQTCFNAAVQLVPQRTSFTTGESCLTAGTTVTVSVDFGLPLPPVVHVNEAGGECGAHGQFLTRALLMMPYAAPWGEAVLRTVIEEMRCCPRATTDVHAYVEPVPEHHSAAASTTADKTATAAAAAATGKEKSERSSRRGRQSRPGTPPPPAVVEAPSPYLAASIKVVSPAGVSGFEVSDGLVRVFCIEGTVPEVHAILEGAASAAQYDPDLRILLNSELFVPQRLYLTFPPLVTPPECLVAKKAAAQAPAAAPAAEQQAASTSPLPPAPSAAAGGKYEVAEAGGTGGRIHRVRLGQPLEQLVQQQKYLLKRTLSSSCLFAFQCLFQLLSCDSLVEAMNRALFPSAADVISLERSFGRTLDVFDIFGRHEYDTADPAGPTSLPTTSAASPDSVVVPRGAVVDALSVDLAALRRKDVGRLAAFTGTLLLGRVQPISAAVAQRFPKAQWMTTDDGVEVLCVFPRRAPSGTIRYHVEGQVVACGEDMVLYVLDFQTLAKSWTDTHNPAYEAFLTVRARRAKWLAASGTHRIGYPSPAALTKGHSAARHKVTTTDSSDDDDALSPPSMASHDGTLATRSERGLARADLTEPRMTRTAQLRAQVNADAAPPVVSDEVLWQLYKARAPHHTTAASSTTAADGKPRDVMRF